MGGNRTPPAFLIAVKTLTKNGGKGERERNSPAGWRALLGAVAGPIYILFIYKYKIYSPLPPTPLPMFVFNDLHGGESFPPFSPFPPVLLPFSHFLL